MGHRNARTTVYARRLMVQRHLAGWPQARIAEQLGVSRPTVSKWISRYRDEGQAGLEDRSSRPHTTPTRTDPATEAQILALRERERRGAVYLAGELGLVASTVGRVLARHQVPHLAAIDPITGEPVRRRHSGIRYERPQPGDLLHVDVKKLGVINGAGHRVNGRRASQNVTRRGRRQGRAPGWEFVHVCVDDATRLAYVEVLANEQGITAAGFLRRAVAFYASYGITVQRVMSDNGACYRSTIHAVACRLLGLRHLRTRPYRPRTNGKAERFIRTMLGGWAYGAIYATSAERTAALDGWLWTYNHRRPHGSLSHKPPATRLHELNNLPRTYS